MRRLPPGSDLPCSFALLIWLLSKAVLDAQGAACLRAVVLLPTKPMEPEELPHVADADAAASSSYARASASKVGHLFAVCSLTAACAVPPPLD